MAYNFEFLGPERFQAFAQALLVGDYPDLQCFPVGQPDGGRDAMSRRAQATTGSTVVQMKFKRAGEGESADWMIATLKDELPKIDRAIENGASRYIMVTNAQGTAHPDSGRIDKVQSWLDQNVGIEAFCLWRDDLSARLDGASSQLRLAYPELLTGQDALTLIVEATMGHSRQRQVRALRAFVQTQFAMDEHVKFRQVNLSNSLLDLFVDVPVVVSGLAFGQRSRASAELRAHLQRVGRYVPGIEAAGLRDEGGEAAQHIFPTITVGTADLLLGEDFQRDIPWVLLQGAPGQGKSTLAQYVCQVHRAVYLDKVEFLEQLPARHRHTPFRLPFKLDLRDFSNYVSGQPYLGLSEPGPEPRTLERFLSSLVTAQSGGLEFLPDDLVDVFAKLPTLLFFDGLDEVADLRLRSEVIEGLMAGLGRLRENGANIQAVLTSRPSLFGNAQTSRPTFLPLSLAPIPLKTIRDYAEKWVIARDLDESEGTAVKEILRDKLSLSHIRELTRNPMQLTILLSLIHSVGYSLPDVRTELYRQYVDLFLTREAEKSPIVRDHRLLLLEVVEHLAWTLQCQAESARTAGSISREDLRSLVHSFLVAGEHETSILDDLFSGGIERVYVLVQRIEGFYEFEVQPLREYFAARYLYSTAPTGNYRQIEPAGDRAQRVEALASNPYWANVTRFYAGSYQNGELGDLVFSLRALVESPDPAVALLGRGMGVALLSDWVFRAKKSIQSSVVELVFDDVGVALAALALYPAVERVALPSECGRDVLANILFERYAKASPERVSRDVLQLLRDNGGASLLNGFGTWIRQARNEERSRRISVALMAGGGRDLTPQQLDDWLLGDSPSDLERARRFDSLVTANVKLLTTDGSVIEAVIRHLAEYGGGHLRPGNSEVSVLANVLGGNTFLSPRLDQSEYDEQEPGLPDAAVRVRRLLNSIHVVIAELAREGDDSPWESTSYWAKLVDLVHHEFGDAWIPYRLAIENCGMVPKVEPPASSVSVGSGIFATALQARTSRRRAPWWIDQIESAISNHQQLFWVGMLLAWGSSAAVRDSLTFLEGVVDSMSEVEIDKLEPALEIAFMNRGLRGGRNREGVRSVSNPSDRMAGLLLAAFGPDQADLFSGNPVSQQVRRVRSTRVLEADLALFPGWEGLNEEAASAWLERLNRAISETGGVSDPEMFRRLRSPRDMPSALASKVLREPTAYRKVLVQAAYFATIDRFQPVPLRDAAAKGKWSF